MFTGLIQDVGKILFISRNQLKVKTILNINAVGESISVNGVCLTVKVFDNESFTADVSPETLRVTNLGVLKAGDYVNLEKSMSANSLFGGHIVLGHIDAAGKILEIKMEDNFHKITIEIDNDLSRYLVIKGSIAVDGISLTVADIKNNRFVVWVIPETFAKTCLKYKKEAQTVNIESDILAKYVEKMLKKQNSKSDISMDLLNREGFL